jgi:hypothetical protein
VVLRFLVLLVGSLTLALLAACAGLEEPNVDPDPPAQTKRITMGFIVDYGGPETGSQSAGFGWELTVDPEEISGGKEFVAKLGGKVIFDQRSLSEAQRLYGGHKYIMLAVLHATVRVRSGATGEPVVLSPESLSYVCADSTETMCDPRNDLDGVPGIRGNTDCEPQSEDNFCGQLVELPTSEDCDPGGVCDELGHTGDKSQCEVNGFCVSGPIEIALEKKVQLYEAEPSGSVLFGFDDSAATGFWRLEVGGCNDGTWFSGNLAFEDPPRSNSLRVIANGTPSAIEYVMGEDSNGPEGIDSCERHSSPSPDSSLIKFPIL